MHVYKCTKSNPLMIFKFLKLKYDLMKLHEMTVTDEQLYKSSQLD